MTTTSQNTALDLAIAFATTSYSRLTTEQEPVVIRTDLSKQPLVRVKGAKGNRTVKVQPQAVQPVVATVETVAQPATNPSPNGKVAAVKLPEPGTIGAKAYIMMMRRAKDLPEKRAAIAGFIGYDNRKTFAENEMAANAAAKGEISPVSAEGPTRAEKRTAQNSVKGYVAGMPDATGKIVRDLMGRIELGLDECKRLNEELARTDLSPAERQLNDGLIQLETARIESIRADLAKYVG